MFQSVFSTQLDETQSIHFISQIIETIFSQDPILKILKNAQSVLDFFDVEWF